MREHKKKKALKKKAKQQVIVMTTYDSPVLNLEHFCNTSGG